MAEGDKSVGMSTTGKTLLRLKLNNVFYDYTGGDVAQW